MDINDDAVLKGRIDWAGDSFGSEYGTVLVVDGKRITFEQLALMLSTYEGFNFIFKVCDQSEGD